MDDDFNSPLLIAHLFEAVKFINLVLYKDHPINQSQWKRLNKMMEVFTHDILGIVPLKSHSNANEETLNEVINLLIELRNSARLNKDFVTSDRIRDQLLELGIQLKDSEEGTHFTIN